MDTEPTEQIGQAIGDDSELVKKFGASNSRIEAEMRKQEAVNKGIG